MKELAEHDGLSFPYLHDSSQTIGKELGATVTPQFFILDEQRTLVYRGPWDDQVNPSKVKTHFVEQVVDALRSGKPSPVSEVRGIGCRIIYAR